MVHWTAASVGKWSVSYTVTVGSHVLGSYVVGS